MVNLSSNNSNNINLSGQTQRNVNVSTPNTNNVDANTMGNSQRARSWAIGEGLIDGEDYSAKYYAQQAKEIEEDIAADTNNAYIWAEGTDEEVQALGGEHSSKGWVNYVLTNPPTATVEQISAGAVITIHDIDGTTTATIYNGQDGTDGLDGTDGQDGFSPIATITKSGDTATISITDKTGTTTAAITDGTNGTNGIDGQDGFSPVANVTQTSSGATITITDSIGTTTANITNGVNGTNGTNGADGFSPTATVTKSGTISTITITDKNGTTTANVYDGTGGVSDVTVNGTSVLDGTTAKIDLTDYVTTNTTQTVSARKTFTGEKAIYFKQVATTNKLGFTLYNPSDTELGAFEYRPNTISGGALLNVNVPYSSSNYVGFRYWGTAVNVIAPKVATAGNYFIPTHITDGNTTVTANSAGLINISSLLPSGGGAVDSVNGQTGDVVLTASDVGALPDTTVIPTKTSDLTNDSDFTTSSDFKTINNTSIVGSGNIDTSEIFIATSGTTTYAEVLDARTNGKNVICKIGSGSTTNAYYPLIFEAATYGVFEFSGITGLGTIEVITLDSTNNWSSSTTYPANTSLSNLVSEGQKVIDGQWVASNTTIQNGNKNTGQYTIDLSNILPNDSYAYECIFTCDCATGTTSGNKADIRMGTTLTPSVFLAVTQTRTASAVACGGAATVIVGADRTCTYSVVTDNVSNLRISLASYRRIGTNT